MANFINFVDNFVCVLRILRHFPSVFSARPPSVPESAQDQGTGAWTNATHMPFWIARIRSTKCVFQHIAWSRPTRNPDEW